jgi:hypothetical protein
MSKELKLPKGFIEGLERGEVEISVGVLKRPIRTTLAWLMMVLAIIIIINS